MTRALGGLDYSSGSSAHTGGPIGYGAMPVRALATSGPYTSLRKEKN